MEKTCCLCGEEFEGYGNNPAPLKESGECCDHCYTEKVIPARYEAMFTSGKTAEKFAR